MTNEFSPAMTRDEIALLAWALPENAGVLEFGSGGSTQFFFENGVKTLVSVESDPAWLEKLFTNPVIRTFKKYGKWLSLYADIGPTREWGAPVSPEPQAIWLNYHQYCWKKFADRRFDLVLVDGRFRVACVCQALLRCGNERPVIVIHDFWNRPGYHVVLDFLETIGQKDSLGVFRPKSGLDWRELSLVLQTHQFNWE